ncbi:hypothetical protein DNTS_018956 [Danionella cerebrum]|uniref:Uncharacterized protein n=1 Tax=Danionella cerebrum TaxID=2873325 RepID=A0A553QBZ3_9TELE|nr:hypothetical protein DNTS_018956 [Danionella translucida]
MNLIQIQLMYPQWIYILLLSVENKRLSLDRALNITLYFFCAVRNARRVFAVSDSFHVWMRSPLFKCFINSDIRLKSWLRWILSTSCTVFS